jgi:uncharacterized protein
MARNRLAMTLLLLMAVAAPAAAQSGALNSPSVVTEGHASIKVTPDLAWLTVSSEARAPRPADAQRASAQAIDNVRASLRKAGVKDDAVKTRSYSVDPDMQYANGKSTVIGYIARQSLDVRVDNLSDLGAIIDAAGGAGATSVSDIRYDTKQRAEIEAQALALAVKDGLTRAETLATAAGRTVLSLWRIDDQNIRSGPRPMPVMMAAAKSVASAETSIAPADLEIQAAVTVTVILR